VSFTPEQIALRRNTMGASEIAAVCGLDPFRGPWDVWADKLGLDIREEFAESDMGHLFERPLLEHYSRKTGVVLAYPETLIHPIHRWVSATPDGLASDRVVQVKVVGANMAHKWDAGVPEYVICQVQWEMLVTGLPLAVVVACVGGTDYRALDVPADRELQNTLYAIGRDFWFDHVLSGVPPDPDASEACRKALAARYRKAEGVIPATAELVSLACKHKSLGASLAALKEERDAIGNVLRLAIGEHAGFEWESGRCTWKPDKNGNRTLLVNLRGERK
jgi:putative phage-type endonuclease